MFWLPFALALINVMLGGFTGMELFGIVAGHLWCSFSDRYPRGLVRWAGAKRRTAARFLAGFSARGRASPIHAVPAYAELLHLRAAWGAARARDCC